MKDKLYHQLRKEHTGIIFIIDDGVDCDFVWEGGETTLITTEFIEAYCDTNHIERLIDGGLRVGPYILDMVTQHPELNIFIGKRRQLELP